MGCILDRVRRESSDWAPVWLISLLNTDRSEGVLAQAMLVSRVACRPSSCMRKLWNGCSTVSSNGPNFTRVTLPMGPGGTRFMFAPIVTGHPETLIYLCQSEPTLVFCTCSTYRATRRLQAYTFVTVTNSFGIIEWSMSPPTKWSVLVAPSCLIQPNRAHFMFCIDQLRLSIPNRCNGVRTSKLKDKNLHNND
jgi:hypothetical protein